MKKGFPRLAGGAARCVLVLSLSACSAEGNSADSDSGDENQLGADAGTGGSGSGDDGATPGADSSSEGSSTTGGTSSGTTGGGSTSSGSASSGDRCSVIKASIEEAGFGSEVTVTCANGVASLASDTYPDHDLMNGITGTNEQVPVPAPGYVSPIPLAPKTSTRLTTIDAALGVAVNGVPIYDYSSQGELDVTKYDPKADTVLQGQLDLCGGHAGRGDDYHYHAAPTCMISAMKNRGPSAIIGWAFDGYPIYGNENPDGTPIAAGTLDVCNGQADATFGHRYHTSKTPPYITQCLVGEVNMATLPRVAPLASSMGGGKGPGMPPQGGVQNLTFTQQANGTRRMEYTYGGKSYFIQYSPSSTSGCYDFDSVTVTSGGVEQKGTYCRATGAKP